MGIERNLRKIARNRKALEEKLQRIRNTDKTLESITGKYEKELQDIKKLRQAILEEARAEAEEIVRNANRKVESTIRAIKEAQAEKDETRKARSGLQDFVTALAMKKEWKTIGPVAHKVSDNIWKRFNEACNFFFEKKNEATAGQRKEEEANLELKKAVISELAQIAEEPVENQLQAVRDLQARWSEIGHVPYNKKEKMYRRYRELCDKIYDALHETAGRRRMDSFRKKAAEKEGSELARELTRLQNALEAKKQEVKNYETLPY